MYFSATELECTSACCIGMIAKEVSPEHARSRGEKGKGVAKNRDGVRYCWRASRSRSSRRRCVLPEGEAITNGRVKAHGRQDNGHTNWQCEHDQD